MNDASVASPMTMSENDDLFSRPPCGIVGTSPDKSKLGSGVMDSDGKMNSNPRGDLNFDISNWSPEVPTGLEFSYLQPFEAESLSSDNTLHEFVGKVRRPRSRLYCRRGAVVLNKNPLGKDLKGERKLRNAANKGDVDEVRRLLDEGTNPNRSDDKGRAALHVAVTKGCQEMVQSLLDKGANVNQKDGLGNTPLHLAVFSNHMGIVTTLLESGANTHELDREGHTPVHLARSRLRHIKDSSCSISSVQLHNEVMQLVSMLKVYMTSIGLSEHIQRLDQLSLQVQESTTTEQVDAIEDILNNFTSLSLQKP